MRGNLTLKILEAVGSGLANAGDLLEAFLTAGYGASRGKIEYQMVRARQRREMARKRRESDKSKSEQRYYSIIYKLKQEGLIKENGSRGNKLFSITKKGLLKLSDLRARKRSSLPDTFYQTKESNQIIVVAFDIPEKYRRKRVWLRSVLKNLDFRMVQKSVWLGKVKIPQDCLKDMSVIGILHFVEIFEITKTGSLKQIILPAKSINSATY